MAEIYIKGQVEPEEACRLVAERIMNGHEVGMGCNQILNAAAKDIEALKRENEAKDEALRKILEGLLGFRACMESQRTDGPLPVGHDDPDESCGDGICFRSGATIDEDIAAIKAALSSKAKQ